MAKIMYISLKKAFLDGKIVMYIFLIKTKSKPKNLHAKEGACQAPLGFRPKVLAHKRFQVPNHSTL